MDFDKYVYNPVRSDVKSNDKKRAVVGGRLTRDSDPIPSECAPHVKGDICSRPTEVSKMRRFLARIVPEMTSADITTLKDPEVINQIKSALELDHESEIYTSETFRHFVGEKTADAALKFQFKPEGPWKSTALLDNFNIDDCMDQWAKHSKRVFDKKFYHVFFQMIDFEKVKSELALLHVPTIISDGFDCMGVVLNTDVSSGRGKHWFCIYCDFTPPGTKDKPYTLEFFNSSGNPPRPEVSHWLNTTKHSILRDMKKHAKIIIVSDAPSTKMRHKNHVLQHSKTECGVWSLMYIKYRLDGKSCNWLYENNATDKDMEIFRAYLFRHS